MNLNLEFLKNNSGLPKFISAGPLENFSEKVLQFGEGNFLRAFFDWQINELNKKGLFNGKIIVAQPLEKGMIDQLNKQDGLFTLLLRGLKNGEKVENLNLVTSVSRGINPYSNWDEFLSCAALPELKFIVSNTTEAGIEYKNVNKPDKECPNTFPAKLTAFLYKRFKVFSGESSKGMTILPCELIENNGNTLKEYIIRHAKDWNLENEFLKWINEDNYFFNTLVDRIVPGYPKDEVETITEKIGYDDKLLVSAEPYYLWVLQGDKKTGSALPFLKGNLNVILTDDITPYRSLKVRILNGCHTMFTIPSFLSGCGTVVETFNDTILTKFIHEGLYNEILPTLDFPHKEKEKFADVVIERFKNPFIKHQLLSITLNSVSKFKVRVLPSLKKYFELKNELPEILTFSLSSLIVFYISYFKNGSSNNAEFGNIKYLIKDDQEIINFFYNIKIKYGNDLNKMTYEILCNINLWGENLNLLKDLCEKVSLNIKKIQDEGMKEALKELKGL